MSDYKNINLLPYRGNNSRLFTGRPQGIQAREAIDISSIEDKFDYLKIEIPKGTTSLNPSFFLGMFFESYKKFGDEEFRKHFQFIHEDSSNPFKNIIDQNIHEGIRLAKNSLKDSQSLNDFF